MALVAKFRIHIVGIGAICVCHTDFFLEQTILKLTL